MEDPLEYIFVEKDYLIQKSVKKLYKMKKPKTQRS